MASKPVTAVSWASDDMTKIRLLRPALVSRIAAGEVIERPASVAKELIENALDSGAGRIDVEVNGGGVTALRVSDDGEGIPSSELEAAFTRYATSKIGDEADLDHIGTLGFRGEALASMGTVADVTLISRTARSLSGAAIHVRGGEVQDQGPRASSIGTTVIVRHLFRDVPARLKFLKSNSAETSRIASVVGHYALSRPGVALSLAIDGKETFRSQGDGSGRTAFGALYGPNVAAQMQEVHWAGDIAGIGFEIKGLISPASMTRGNRRFVTLFVNGRLIYSRSLVFAVLEAYRGFLSSGRYPVAVLGVQVDPSETDVNVHPTKAEIKFRDERLVFSAIHTAVAESLDSGVVHRVVKGGWSTRPQYVSTTTQPSPVEAVGQNSPARSEPVPAGPASESQGTLRIPVLRVLGQINSTFIISEGPEGMYLIDQHTAHERVLFDELRRDRDRDEVKAQGLLTPAVVELTPDRQALVDEHLGLLTGYGFQMEPFGDRAVLLRSVPVRLAKTEPGRALMDVLDYLDSDDLRGYDWEERILASVACHSAVRAGQSLSVQEMQEMMRLLESADNPHACPHGRPIIVHLSIDQLEREFDRR